MKICYLGSGTWGFTLADLLARKGHSVVVWTVNQEMADRLNSGGDHPNLKGHTKPDTMTVTTNLEEALSGAELLCEGVTSAGIRPVFSKVRDIGVPDCAICTTSKGIEQNTGLLLTDVVVEVIGEQHKSQVGCLSGPSHAEEVIKGLPTSVVCSAYEDPVRMAIRDAFSTPLFRVYPNADIKGVEFGGAMKNIVAIACGIADGLGFGDNTKAALMTRGLHEIRKLALEMGCKASTVNGLAGMGDLCVTCLSIHSRNYRFGRLLADGKGVDEAKKSIGMVVEGAYSCVSAMQLSKKTGIVLPIAEAVYQIIYDNMSPKDAVRHLMEREVKEEHL